MLMKNLKEEYKIRYNFMRYKKLHKLYLYNIFEKNNYNIIQSTIEDILVNKN